MKPKILSRKITYRGAWLTVEKAKLKLPTGKITEWEMSMSSDFVAIVPIDDKMNIYLSKEWRLAWEDEVLQIPAGQCKGKTEKAILKQARNELREEAGLDAKKWEKLLTCPFAARKRQRIHLFLARDLFKSRKEPDEDEVIEAVKMPFKKAYRLFLSGKKLTTSYTVLGMALAKEKLNL